ncbi:MAG: hypothetical protein HXS46_20640 [Theionarchaea archaeon]|nr:MAG: hypothetical protein AYK18_08865 [Theionarchaea archaeon DG-70]MBU7013096.1 hypothetical protein [Theionarchaea archaeon]
MVHDELSYSELLAIIQNLDTDDQLRLVEEISMIIRSKMKVKKHSIQELKGLGKEIWESIDTQEYVNREGDSWIG